MDKAAIREKLESGFIKSTLTLPKKLRGPLLGKGPKDKRGGGLHPDFASILGIQKILKAPSLEQIGKLQGMAVARQEYAHVMRMGARNECESSVQRQSILIDSAEKNGNSYVKRTGRLYTPSTNSQTNTLMVYFHGGGFMLGDIHCYDPLLSFICENSGVAVLSVDYRLAPENPYPAGRDDCISALEQVITKTLNGLPLRYDKIFVGGDSAGAVLAISSAHAISQKGLAISGLWLFNPGVHVMGMYPSDTDFGEGCGFTHDMRVWFESQYSGSMKPTNDKGMSPLFLDDLHVLPNTWVSVGGCDPLRDQVELFAQKLKDSGVKTEFVIEPGFIHNYLSFLGVVKDAREATLRACRWLAA